MRFQPDRRRRLEETVEPLSRCSPWLVVVPLVPFVLTVFVIAAGFAMTRGERALFPPEYANVVLGVAYLGVLVVLYWRWDRATWNASAVFSRPSRNELGAGLLAALVGSVLLIPAANAVARTLELTLHEAPELTTTSELVAFLFAAVLVAPVAEEVLFRGVLLGYLLSRGYGLLLAAVLSVLLFSVIHVLIVGPVNVLIAAALGTLLTVLRLWYNNLVGAWLMHALTNLAALLIGLAAIPPLY